MNLIYNKQIINFLIYFIVFSYFIFFIIIYLSYNRPNNELFHNYNLDKIDYKKDIKLNNYHIVCAKYNKNTDFLNKISISNTVLEKDKSNKIIEIDFNNDKIPNIANEATTYLYYIIKNYNNLPQNIIFIHDEDESWHHNGKISENIYEWIKKFEIENSHYYEINNTFICKCHCSYINEFLIFWEDCMKDKFGEFHKAHPSIGKGCAQFIISKNRILSNSRNFYVNLYKWLIDKTVGTGNGDPLNPYSGYNTGRYLEWSWRFIFSYGNYNFYP